MIEKFKFGRKPEMAVQEVIIPVEGLEGKTYSLPEVGESDSPVGLHKDDWYIVGEKADDYGNIAVSLSRYSDDGKIESRFDIPADDFETYQVDVDAERRVRDSQKDTTKYLGASAVRMSIVDMVRNVRNDPTNEKYAGLAALEKWTDEELRKNDDARHSESLATIEDYRKAKRRENPIKKFQQGKHHPGR